MPTDTLPEINPAKRYSAAMDSVNLISDRLASLPENQDSQKRKDDVDRNVAHLEIAVGWDIWTTEDLSPLQNAITQGKAWLEANP